jgi:hypothetical protein
VDVTRSRRTRDDGRKLWYASHRQWRFARFVWGLATAQPPRIEARGFCGRISLDAPSEVPGNGSLASRVEGRGNR